MKPTTLQDKYGVTHTPIESRDGRAHLNGRTVPECRASWDRHDDESYRLVEAELSCPRCLAGKVARERLSKSYRHRATS